MKKELNQLMTERADLMLHKNITADLANSEEAEEVFYVEFDEEEGAMDSEDVIESIIVDFDYDAEDDSNFQKYMALKFMWNDWKTILTDIY